MSRILLVLVYILTRGPDYWLYHIIVSCIAKETFQIAILRCYKTFDYINICNKILFVVSLDCNAFTGKDYLIYRRQATRITVGFICEGIFYFEISFFVAKANLAQSGVTT